MVAARALVDLGRAAEFGGHHDQRGIEQAALIEIGNQAGEGVIESGHAVGDGFLDALVVVPAVGTAVHHGDQADAGFDQAPRQHQLAAHADDLSAARVLILAVELGHGLGLAIERKRFARFRRTDQLVGLLVELAHGVEFGGVGFDLTEMIFQRFARGAAAIETFLGHPLRQRDIAHLEILLAGIGAQFERAELRTEIAGSAL